MKDGRVLAAAIIQSKSEAAPQMRGIIAAQGAAPNADSLRKIVTHNASSAIDTFPARQLITVLG